MANTDAFTRILEVFADAELRLRDASSKKIMVEVALLRAIEARNALPLDVVLKQLNQLRGGQSGAGVSPAQSPAMERRAPSRPETAVAHKHAESALGSPSATPVALAETPVISADLAATWTKLVEAVSRVSPFIRTYLLEAGPISFDKNTLVIGFDPEFSDHLALIDNPRNHALLQTKLAEIGHPGSQIKFIKAEASVGRQRASVPEVAATLTAGIPATLVVPPAPKAAAASASAVAKEKATVTFNKNDFKNDPLIQKALEIFKGQIVEVRA